MFCVSVVKNFRNVCLLCVRLGATKTTLFALFVHYIILNDSPFLCSSIPFLFHLLFLCSYSFGMHMHKIMVIILTWFCEWLNVCATTTTGCSVVIGVDSTKSTSCVKLNTRNSIEYLENSCWREFLSAGIMWAVGNVISQIQTQRLL